MRSCVLCCFLTKTDRQTDRSVLFFFLGVLCSEKRERNQRGVIFGGGREKLFSLSLHGSRFTFLETRDSSHNMGTERHCVLFSSVYEFLRDNFLLWFFRVLEQRRGERARESSTGERDIWRRRSFVVIYITSLSLFSASSHALTQTVVGRFIEH